MAGMICVAREAAAAAAAGFGASPFAGTGVEVPGFLGSAGFAELARPNTGGPSTGPGAGFECASLLLAAAANAAANALADCQVPSPIQVLFPCKALETVKSPWETPVRTASYTVPLSSAMGTGAALYALAS